MPLHSIATDRTSSLSPSRLCKRPLAILRKNRLNALAVLLLDRLINLEITMELLTQAPLSRRHRLSISRRILGLHARSAHRSFERLSLLISVINIDRRVSSLCTSPILNLHLRLSIHELSFESAATLARETRCPRR